MNLRHVFTVLAAVLLNATSVIAQSYPDYFIPQHLRPADPQMAAMGLTGVAHRTGVLAAYSNPAGIADVKDLQFAYTRHHPILQYFTTDEYYTGQHTFSLAVPVTKFFTIGAYYWNLGFGEVEILEINGYGGKKTKIGIREYLLTPAFLLALDSTTNLHIGANVKNLKYYGLNDADSWLYDLGFRINHELSTQVLSFGATIHNLGSKLKVEGSTREYEMYRWYKVGFAFGNTNAKSSKNKKITYLWTVEYQKNLNQKNLNMDENRISTGYGKLEALNTGFELRLFQHLFGQIGYVNDVSGSKNYLEYQGFTYGFGFETPEPLGEKIPVTLSAMYGRSIQLGTLDVNIFSAGLGFHF